MAESHPYPRLYEASQNGGGIYVANAYWREVEAGHSNAMMGLVHICDLMGIHATFQPVVNDALIIRARNRGASGFLESRADVFVSIDSDIEFDPQHLLRIAEKAYEYDIIGGAYVKRTGHSPELAIRLLTTEAEQEIVFAEGQPPAEVEYLATGFMAVHRRVFEKIRDEWHGGLEIQHPSSLRFYPFFDPISVRKESGEIYRLSEDWSFCQRARDVGFKCYIDPTVRLRHWGLYDFTLEDAVRPPRPVPGVIIWHRKGTMEKVGYAEQPWFVRAKDGFLIRLSQEDTHISPMIASSGEWEPAVSSILRKHLTKGKRFLDIGASIGYFSLLAASKGAEVTAIEPNPEAVEYLNDSAQANRYSIQVIPLAVSNTSGNFSLTAKGLKGNHGEAYLIPETEYFPMVQTAVLSELVEGPFAVIKMDIEGEEMNVIKGSPEVFRAAEMIIFEVSERQLRRNSQCSAEELLQWFADNGFHCKKVSGHPTYEDWVAVRDAKLLGDL
jgi:FkbM family methyltransferase